MKRIVLREIRRGRSFALFALEGESDCPILEFLQQLQTTDQNEFDKILALLSRSAEEGPPRNPQKSRAVGEGVMEFKTTRSRLCWFYDENQMIIVTHGFPKGSPKIQDKEIKRAKAIKREYFLNKKAGAKIEIKEEGKQ